MTGEVTVLVFRVYGKWMFEMTKAEQAERANTLYESEEGVVLGVEAGIADV